MTQGLHQFMAMAGPWAYLVVGLMACAETGALVGLVVPGEITLLMAGFLAFTGHVSLLVMMVVAGVGAVAGDSISYRIGRRLGPRVRASRLGRRVSAERWDRTEDYLRRRGGWAVLFGRWVGLLRALVPMLAGMGRLPYARFLAYGVPGGLAWGAGTVALGYAAGSSYELVEQFSGRVGLLVAAGLVALAAAGLGVHRLTRPRTPVVAGAVGAECGGAECVRAERARATPSGRPVQR
ncbi:DedA family protein [Microbispora bryophytorum]|uniref:DedA family protein n=1 Tax=Microbispora bryophytorum TaxID=1460882 RepID=UPI0033F239EA